MDAQTAWEVRYYRTCLRKLFHNPYIRVTPLDDDSVYQKMFIEPCNVFGIQPQTMLSYIDKYPALAYELPYRAKYFRGNSLSGDPLITLFGDLPGETHLLRTLTWTGCTDLIPAHITLPHDFYVEDLGIVSPIEVEKVKISGLTGVTKESLLFEYAKVLFPDWKINVEHYDMNLREFVKSEISISDPSCPPHEFFAYPGYDTHAALYEHLITEGIDDRRLLAYLEPLLAPWRKWARLTYSVNPDARKISYSEHEIRKHLFYPELPNLAEDEMKKQYAERNKGNLCNVYSDGHVRYLDTIDSEAVGTLPIMLARQLNSPYIWHVSHLQQYKFDWEALVTYCDTLPIDCGRIRVDNFFEDGFSRIAKPTMCDRVIYQLPLTEKRPLITVIDKYVDIKEIV